jgi:hypothetical protein
MLRLCSCLCCSLFVHACGDHYPLSVCAVLLFYIDIDDACVQLPDWSLKALDGYSTAKRGDHQTKELRLLCMYVWQYYVMYVLANVHYVCKYIQ